MALRWIVILGNFTFHSSSIVILLLLISYPHWNISRFSSNQCLIPTQPFNYVCVKILSQIESSHLSRPAFPSIRIPVFNRLCLLPPSPCLALLPGLKYQCGVGRHVWLKALQCHTSATPETCLARLGKLNTCWSDLRAHSSKPKLSSQWDHCNLLMAR